MQDDMEVILFASERILALSCITVKQTVSSYISTNASIKNDSFPSRASEHSWMSSNAEKKRRDKVADILSTILVSLCYVLPLPVMYLTDIRGHTCIPFPQVFPLTSCMPEPWLCAGSRAILLPWMRPPDILFICFILVNGWSTAGIQPDSFSIFKGWLPISSLSSKPSTLKDLTGMNLPIMKSIHYGNVCGGQEETVGFSSVCVPKPTLSVYFPFLFSSCYPSFSSSGFCPAFSTLALTVWAAYCTLGA